MTVAIIGAMEEEVSLLIEQFDRVERQTIYGYEFYLGELAGKEVVLLQSGIGKVSAALGVALLKERFNCECVINTGSAGGLRDDLGLGSVVVSSEVKYFDVDVTAFGYELGQMARMPVSFVAAKPLLAKAQQVAEAVPEITVEPGLIVSGDAFVSESSKVEKIKADFPDAYALEMEAGGIAQACFQVGLPFVIIRSISDSADGDAKLTHEEFLQLAANNSAKLVLALLRQL